ncbi:hypothetical protein [Roseibium sp. M-1]
MPKISLARYYEILADLNSSDEEIRRYSRIVKGQGGFDFRLEPDPEKVELVDGLMELENAMSIGNGLARWRRRRVFMNRLNSDEKTPVLVSEGDSWFQFPMLIDEVIDQLGPKYRIYSVGAAGDTAQNMVHGPLNNGGCEYMTALREVRDHVKAFLFSAAGNDIIGEDPQTGVAALYELIRPFNGDAGDVQGHINHGVLKDKLDFLRSAYRKMITDVRADPSFTQLPIVIHGYDYAFPYPHGNNDKRNPRYAANNEWLGEPLDDRKITDGKLRRNIIKYLVDELYVMLSGLAGQSKKTRIWVVDCRGALPKVTDWNDEIHATSKGFSKIADRFHETLQKAMA